jgi:alcohol dehydrogenase class IV
MKEYERIAAALTLKGIETVCYAKVLTEPDLHMINGGREIFLKERCNAMIALGGGSVIDAAKAINMLCANGGNIESYQMDGRQVTHHGPLFIAIPTTSGAGAEATKISVITNNYNGLKKSLHHASMIADIVILDPLQTTSLPANLTATTGMDALSHAIESFVSLNANTLTEIYGLKAIELINGALLKAVREPENIEARSDMMLGSYLAGCATAAGVGVAHIMAQPLGGIYKIPHGDACSIFLPTSMELNLSFATKKYAKIAQALGVARTTGSDRENAESGVNRVKALRKEIGAPTALRSYIVTQEYDVDEVMNVIKSTTGHISCNPRPLDDDFMKEIFHRCL